MADQRLTDQFDSTRDFEDLLEEAEAQASGSWEMEFSAGIRAKYTQYGMQMFALSDKQYAALNRIAKRTE